MNSVESKLKTILVADDEFLIQELIAEMLRSAGYNVVSASNGFEVLDLDEKNNIDLFLIDKKMPGMDGVACIGEIRKRNLQVPVILVSGSELEDKGILQSLNISEFITKPFQFDELLRIIKHLIIH